MNNEHHHPQDLSSLIAQTFAESSPEKQKYLSEILFTISKFIEESPDTGDIKMINTSLKELRYSFKLFAPFRDIRKVCMFGSARTHETIPEYHIANDFAKKITQKGYMLITGAGSGIMEAGNRGAILNSSFGVNIQLPFEQSPNPYIYDDGKLITLKYFYNRKVIFIKESDATILFPGGFGTHDEAFENLTLIQTGKCAPRPIILIASPENDYWQKWLEFIKNEMLHDAFISEDDLSLFTVVSNADDAVNQIQQFYRVYHSTRYIHNLTILRLNKELPNKLIQELNQQFSDIIISGAIEKLPFGQQRIDQNQFPDKHRIAFQFNRTNYGRLIDLINQINQQA